VKGFFVILIFTTLAVAVLFAAVSAFENGNLPRFAFLPVVLPILWYLLKSFIELLDRFNIHHFHYWSTLFLLTIAFILFAFFCFQFVIKANKPRSQSAGNNGKKLSKSFPQVKNFRKGGVKK
jgi:hypothetical protein